MKVDDIVEKLLDDTKLILYDSEVGGEKLTLFDCPSLFINKDLDVTHY